MRNAIEVRVDLEVGAGYVRYRPLEDGERVGSSVRLSQDVVVDFDDAGKVLGIELISMIPEALAIAHEYAHQNDLVFPDLSGSTIASLALAHG